MATRNTYIRSANTGLDGSGTIAWFQGSARTETVLRIEGTAAEAAAANVIRVWKQGPSRKIALLGDTQAFQTGTPSATVRSARFVWRPLDENGEPAPLVLEKGWRLGVTSVNDENWDATLVVQ
jgi:hypothetical protein